MSLIVRRAVALAIIAGLGITGLGLVSIGSSQTAEAARCSSGKRFVKNYGCVPKTVYAQAKKLCAKFKEPASWCIVSNGPGEFHAHRITD